MLIEVPDLEILTEGLGMADAVEMARDAIGLKGNGSYKNNQSNCKGKHRRLEETIHVHAEVGKNIKNVVGNKKKNCFYALSVLRLCTIINPIREA